MNLDSVYHLFLDIGIGRTAGVLNQTHPKKTMGLAAVGEYACEDEPLDEFI